MAANIPAAAAYPDDGHIFVCVRVRDVPQNPCLTSTSSSSNNASGGGGGAQPRKTAVLKEAQKICVSTLENVVVMHDPKSLEDAATVARDANNVVQLLTDRANAASSAANHLSAAGERPSTRPSTRKSTGTRTRSSTGAGKKGGNANRQLIGTQTASYYECDQCITSMDEAAMLKMPMIKSSDFLQPPPYGSQEDVYRSTAMHAVSAAVEGINSCVFAYGQTGSGKTYTLFGDTTNMRRDPGIVPRTLDDLFGQLEGIKASHGANADTDYSYAVSLSFFEIYNNEVYCLFSRRGPLHVQFMRDPSGKRETMIISDLQQQTVTSAEKAYPLVEMGLRRRQTGETGMNARSSRSHAILQVRVTQWHTNRDTRETVEHNATINLVDLAGSERQKTANTQGKNRDEGIQINQSLATLARVINDIASGAKFVNYRDSLLTMVLKDNLGGNSKTFMIATVSPIAFSYQESCATLTYAKDVRRIRNRPTVNRTFQTKANLLEQNSRLKSENEKLKEQMEEWMRRWNHPGGGGGGASSYGDISAITLSPEGTPGKGFGLYGGPITTGALSPVAAGTHADEALIAATSAAGLTAPLVISSHRKYANIAGIGGSCVEGGVIRVTSLVGEKARLHLSDILRQGMPATSAGTAKRHSKAGERNGESEEEEKDAATPKRRRLTGSSVADLLPTDSDDDEVDDDDAMPPSRATATTTATDNDNGGSEEDGESGFPVVDFGYLEFERVGQRSCEQRFYVHFVLPKEEAACAAIVDIQVNGKSIGTDGRREMHHGDVLCAYLESVGDGAGSEQNLLAFHYVDLNCLSRTAASLNHATLGQLAVSVDLPSEMEGLTIDDIQQLQRDRDKLLDLVQQQKQTIEFQCQQQKAGRGLSFISSMSPSPEGERSSPEPRGLERSPSTATPALAQKAALEAFKRTSISPTIRGRSMLPADIDNEELLQRAQEQSQSQARLDGAMDENKQLHRAVATRNATLEALAKRLAELEAGGSPSKPRTSGSGGDDEDDDSDEGSSSRQDSSSAGSARNGESESSPLAVGNRTTSFSFVPAASRSLTRVSVSSSDDDDDHQTKGTRRDGEAISTLPILRAQEIVAPVTRANAFFESGEGARERYKAAVREAQLNDRIAELEALVAELRAQLALQESRLRVSKDDTLEQEMLREQVEAERDALLRELAALRAENAELSRDNEQLEMYLKRSEEALAAALAMNDEELLKKAKAMTEQIRALKALALLWKRRAMKYIAMGYGDSAGDLRLDHIPWDELRYGTTAAVAKSHLGAGNSDEASNTIDEFERATAVESVLALEAALSDLENENRRLQEQIKKYEQSLQENRDLMERLKRERDALEQEMRNNVAMDEEERQRLQRLLDRTNKDLAEAETNSRVVQQQLQNTVEQSNANAKKTNRKHDQLLSEQRQKLAEMEAKMDELRDSVVAKDEELRTILRYMEDNDMIGIDGAVRDMELRNRIEDLIHGAMAGYDAPTGYSAFPAEFRFSDEMIALIRVCLRILLDRLKIELYVLNKQNLHRFSLLVPTVQLRPEAQFQVFMHELRGVASEVAGRSHRIGGKWTLTEADVLSNLLDHRRRRAGGALYGLLIWYDHWDLSPKTEHVSYMELIRNSDRIMQMARQVRQESLLNTNATSTLLMPIPSRTGGKSESAYVSESSRRKDKTVGESCRILNRFSASTRRSNLASALNEASTPCKGGEDKENVNEAHPFSRSATALALSQNMAFSRTSSAMPAFHNTTITSPGVSPAKPPRPTGGNTPPPLPMGPASSAAAARTSSAAHAAILASPQHAPTPEAAMLATTPQRQNAHAAYSRVASAGVMPVSDSDIAFVAGTDVEHASAMNRFNFERRMSLNGLLAQDGGLGSDEGTTAVNRSSKMESFSRKGSTKFSRCQTAMPLTTATTAAAAGGGGARRSAGGGRLSVGGARAPLPAGPSAAAAAAAKKRSVAAPFGRSQSTVVKPTTSLYSGYELPKPKKKKTAKPSLVATTHSGDSDANSFRYEDSALSPKPRTPAGVASKTKRPAAAAGDAEERFAAPTSFYNPSIMESLRQRSGSESNRASALTGIKGQPLAAGAKKFKATPSTKYGLLAPSASKSASAAPGHGKGIKAAKKGTATAFEASRTRPRLSTGSENVAPKSASSNAASATSTTGPAASPVVPALNLSQISK